MFEPGAGGNARSGLVVARTPYGCSPTRGQRDYEAMASMIFGSIPKVDEIVASPSWKIISISTDIADRWASEPAAVSL